MRLLITVIALAAACGALPATAGARAKPHAVVKSVSAQGPAAPGDEVTARVTIGRSAKGKVGAVKVGLALASGMAPKGGLPLIGKPVTVRMNKARKVKLTLSGVIPGSAPAQAMRLFACIDVTGAVKKGAPRGRCATAPLQITTASAGGKIDAAVAAGKLDAATATLYRVYAIAGDKRLPAEYRGPLGDESTHSIISAAAEAFPTLPASVQRNLFPFFVPPAAARSAWGSPAPKKPKKKAKRSQLQGPVNCNGFSSLEQESDFDGLYAGTWAGIPASDGNSVVHYVQWRPLRQSQDPAEVAAYARIAGEMTASGREAAQRFANAMPRIWDKLTHEFGPPQSDAGVACYNGGDGRFDVYVDGTGIIAANNWDASSVSLPYPQVGIFCTNRPAFVLIKRYEDEWTLAHEFMHALQFAHKYKSCAEPIKFWDEGGADWAANFVYPDSQREQTRAPHNYLITDPLGWAPINSSYGYWPFWLMLERNGGGTGTLRSIFAAMENDQAVVAVDKAIPGGWAQQLPALLIALWNQDPIGKPGFPLNQSFKDWDHWNGTPEVPGKQDLALGGQHEATIQIKTDEHSGQFPLTLGTIQQITISDDKVKEIRFKNGGFGHGVHVDAALHMADDSWKLADWSKESTTLCRDNQDENVKDLIVFSTGVDRSQAFQAAHELRGKDECTPPKYRIDEITYTDSLAATGLLPVASCTPSATQTNHTTLGYPGIDDGPGGGMSPEFPDGHREGLLHAIGTLSKGATFNGCQINQDGTDYIPCVVNSSGTEPYLVEAELNLPPGDDTPARVTWRPRPPRVGDVPPVIGLCIQFGADPTGLPDPVISSEPRSKFFDPGPQTISVDIPLTVPAVNGMLSSHAHYAIKFTRINEDGTPYTG